jgi:hypothetical protein
LEEEARRRVLMHNATITMRKKNKKKSDPAPAAYI